ncbi:MAG: hypothetical protein ACI87W_002414, partial [Halieaceae bacterium]
GLGPISYSWTADNVVVSGSMSTFTPGQDEVGKFIAVIATYTDLQGTVEMVISDPTAAVANVNDDPVGMVTISGTAEQDQLLTAANDLSDLDGLGTISYSWKAGGVEVGTDPTYTPTQDDVGKAIILTVSYTDQQGTAESVDSAPTVAVGSVNDEPVGTVTISGTPEQGQLLTAANDLSDPDGLGAISYSWKAGGAEVGTGPTYTPNQDDVDKTITVTASYTDLQGTAESVDSDPTAAVANVNDDPVGAVTISGTAEQGQLLTAANDLSDLDGLGAISYSWKADGVEVGTDLTYTPTQDDVGKTITVTASYTDQQGTPESVDSDPTIAVASVNDEPIGTVTISGTPEQGQLLTAANDLSDLDGLGAISYSWKADDVEVGTDSTYTTTQDDVGKTITVSAAYTDLQGTEESVASDPTVAVLNVNDDPGGSVSITGTPEQGQTLSAANSLTDLDGLGDITYRWNSGGTDRGSSATLLLTQADVGNAVTVTASYTDQGGFAESVASAASGAVADVNDAPEGLVLIAGELVVDQTLSASNTLSDVDGMGDVTYTWKADDVTVGMGDTYLLSASDVAKTITATAMYTDGGGFAEAAASAGTAPVEASEADPLTSTRYYIALEDFIVSPAITRDVIGTLPGTGAEEGVVQNFSILNGIATAEGSMKPGGFGDFLLESDSGAYRYNADRDAIDSATTYASEVFVIAVSDGASTVYRIMNVANFDANEFIVEDANDDGRLYDARFVLDSGDIIVAEDAQLYRAYAGALGRTPDRGGFDWWSDQIEQGNHDLDSMVAGFIFSEEFLGFFGADHPDQISSAAFVTHMYQSVFGRDPDAGGFGFWTGELDSGNRSQEQVVVEMTQSNEFVGLTGLAVVDYLII